MIQCHASAATHCGGRAHNEDACLSRPDLGLWVVADGAGGHANGAAASAAVIAALDSLPPGLAAAELLAQIRLRLAAVHGRLLAEAGAQGSMMASTVVVLIVRDGHFACLWAGDSRAYLLRDGMVVQITQDHSLVQQLIDDGAIDEAEAEAHPQRNVITRAIGGGGRELDLQKVSGSIYPADRFLLCSDGLCKALPEAELTGSLAATTDAAVLVRAAVDHGAPDNVTAVVATMAR